MDCSLQASLPMDSPGKNTGVGCHSLLQGNLPVPVIKFTPPALQAYYLPLSHQGSHVDCLIHVKCVLCSHLVGVVCSHLDANIFVHSFFFFFLPIPQDAARLQYDRSISILRRAQVYVHTPSLSLYTLIGR